MKRRALFGGILVATGGCLALAQIVTFPGMMFGGCTEVGVPEGAGQWQGISIIGVQESTLLYTPDGVNECSIPLVAVLLPIGLIFGGSGIALSSR